ncbi:hypothetical protein B6U98_03520 [Thermoplasmatales archaeon ex4572_165]|nr:MAG: hypothetical protein B6U98_03520 [Thermoplasmatales archaeon ex4572_165]RLF59123.1 MAG: hypothetical protein DRN27_03590 [Thermoplasmata archaeon]
MRKMLSAILVLMLMGSMIPLVLAEETEEYFEINKETQNEIEIMSDNYGAQVRLLQLEKAIKKNIDQGEYILSLLNTTDTYMLEAILAEMKLLVDEVQSVDPDDSDAVQTFVDLKSDAHNLTKDFRETLHSLVNTATINELRLKKNEYKDKELDILSRRIRTCIRAYNGNQFHKLYGYLSIKDKSLIIEYSNGNCSIESVKQNFSEMVYTISSAQRNQVYSKMKESKIQMKVQSQQCLTATSADFQVRKQDRIHIRLNNSLEKGDGLVNQLMQQNLNDKLDNNITKTKDLSNVKVYEVKGGN